MFEIRPFCEKDAKEVSIVMYESFKSFLGDLMTDDSPMPPEYWGRVSNQKDDNNITTSWVASEDGKIIGYLQVTANLKYGLGTLQQIGVSPSCHARGAGTALFQEAERFWKMNKMRKVYTCASSINKKAQAYYAKNGFHTEGILKDHFFDGVDELQLSKFY